MSPTPPSLVGHRGVIIHPEKADERDCTIISQPFFEAGEWYCWVMFDKGTGTLSYVVPVQRINLYGM